MPRAVGERSSKNARVERGMYNMNVAHVPHVAFDAIAHREKPGHQRGERAQCTWRLGAVPHAVICFRSEGTVCRAPLRTT